MYLVLYLLPYDLCRISGVLLKCTEECISLLHMLPVSGRCQKVSSGGIPLDLELFVFNMHVVLNALRSHGQETPHLLLTMGSSEIMRSWRRCTSQDIDSPGEDQLGESSICTEVRFLLIAGLSGLLSKTVVSMYQ